jgi:hypothetical protein
MILYGQDVDAAQGIKAISNLGFPQINSPF